VGQYPPERGVSGWGVVQAASARQARVQAMARMVRISRVNYWYSIRQPYGQNLSPMVDISAAQRRLHVATFAVVAMLLPAAAGASAQALRERHAALEARLEASAFDAPLHVESDDRDGLLRGEIHGVLAQPFDVVRDTLQALQPWCDLVTLHYNVKGCAPGHVGGAKVVTLHTGGRKYEHPRNARQTDFVQTLRAAGPDYFDVAFTAPEGPLDTRDLRLEFRAVPLGEQTFVHVRFSYRYGALTRMLSATYYATFGRHKVGFTVLGTDEAGDPIYIRGRHGAVERSVMLSYLGLRTLFESFALPEERRFEWRLRRWYALTDKYPRQLREMEQAEYLQAKRQERADMLPGQHEAWPQAER
jgi:hypothetical protein